MNKQQEPRLRFKGFTGAWKKKTLNDVSEVFEYGLNAQAVNFDGVHKYIRITDIDDESRQFLQENVTSPDVDFSKVDNYKLQKGDLLFARTGASVGKSYLYDENDGLVYFAGFLIRAKLKKEVDDQFIFQNTLTNHFNRFITLTSQRSGQPGINSKEYSKFEFLAPSLPEQTHLGLFFRRLDSQIAESRAVLEKSRQLKKAMLAKMFPANGEKIPKIRFEGFEGEWESRKLGEIVDVVMGQSPPSTSYTDNPNDFILVQGNADMKNGKVCPRIWTTELTKQGKVGDIIMSVRAPVGDVGKTDYDIVIGRGVCAIKGDEFIYQTLWKMKSDCYWDVVSSGSTFEAVNSNDIKNAEVLMPPTPKEQIKIGNFFRQLDETIALQSAEVEKLNQLKKGLLAAMLV